MLLLLLLLVVVVVVVVLLWKAPRPYFALQNSHAHAIEFLRNLQFGPTPSKRFASPDLYTS